MKGKVSPVEMFRPPHTEEFGTWDDMGFPTSLKDGTPLAAARAKRLKKDQQVQGKAHERYLEAAKRGEIKA